MDLQSQENNAYYLKYSWMIKLSEQNIAFSGHSKQK